MKTRLPIVLLAGLMLCGCNSYRQELIRQALTQPDPNPYSRVHRSPVERAMNDSRWPTPPPAMEIPCPDPSINNYVPPLPAGMRFGYVVMRGDGYVMMCYPHHPTYPPLHFIATKSHGN